MDKLESSCGSSEYKGKTCGVIVTQGVETFNPIVAASEQIHQELFPGILNEITLSIITPLLSWRNLRVLYPTSREWREAFRSRLVFNSRLHGPSPESLLVFTQSRLLPSLVGQMCMKTISLYSTRDHFLYELPTIPGFLQGMPHNCGTVAFDGKLYVLGGRLNDGHTISLLRTVYVLDLAAGQMQWKCCTSMQFGRCDGKIYVFGGCSFDCTPNNPKKRCNPRNRCEVYDPNVDAWTSIKPMPTMHHGYEVAIVGEELFLYGGELTCYCKGNKPPTPEGYPWDFMDDAAFKTFVSFADFAEAYHPVSDKWRVVIDYKGPGLDKLSQLGKFQVTATGVYERGTDDSLWKRLKLFLTPEELVERHGSHKVLHEDKLLVVGDKLMALGEDNRNGDRFLLQTSGLPNRRCMWTSIMQVEKKSSFLCSIQL